MIRRASDAIVLSVIATAVVVSVLFEAAVDYWREHA